MKKTTNRIVSIALAVFMLVSVLAGCMNEDIPTEHPPPPQMQSPEDTPTPATPPPTPSPTPEDVFIPFEERTELIFGARYVHPSIIPAVARFNETSGTHRITIVDYKQYDSNENDWIGSIDVLAAEIIDGTAPDIIDVSIMPYQQWAANGAFVDLYPLIDADPGINRSDFIESVLKTVEINGGLYQVFDSFGINTIVGNPSVLGENTHWTIGELVSIINKNQRARWPLGLQAKDDILRDFILMNASSFIDWSSGTAHFDEGDFVELLKFANRFPTDWPGYNDPIWNQNLIAEKRQIMQILPLNYFTGTFSELCELFGGDIIFKGFPVETGSGNLVSIESGLAILAGCSEVEAAWEFIRMFLTEEGQRERIYAGSHLMPTNKVVFNEELQQATQNSDGGISEKEAEQITVMVNTVTNAGFSITRTLEDIIRKNASDFFIWRISALEATRRIQNSVLDYMSEQEE